MDTNYELKTEILQTLSDEFVREYRVIPYSVENDRHLFLTDKIDDEKKSEIEILLGRPCEFIVIPTSEIDYLIAKYYRNASTIARFIDSESDQFMEMIIENAHSLSSSDIHIEASEEKGRIRYRIDGKLVERYIIEISKYFPLINKLKIKAGLDIAEKRIPQDGRIEYKHGVVSCDIRVSTLPTQFGEKAVLRILDKKSDSISLSSIGIPTHIYPTFERAIRNPTGIILISGPTGSGKTTTLYALLKELNSIERNILTIEDPIEYTLEGINQVQVKDNIGFDFTRALRAFLRQDPDVIMIGEIRDNETASIAIRAALTGHLVLSTIHTNSAWETVLRLTDMGIPEFLTANTLIISVAQRLIRKICPKCKEEVCIENDEYYLKYNHLKLPATICIPRGCDFCHYTGYSGRMAIYEVLEINEDIKQIIRNGNINLKQLTEVLQIETIKDGAEKALREKKTSLEEVYTYMI